MPITITGAAVTGGALITVAGDPYFPYVPLLLNTTSTNTQTNNTFLDNSTNNFTITRNGTPTQGSVTPYWPNGQWSNYFNGTTDYLSVPTTTALQFGTGDFTFEFWMYLNSTVSNLAEIYNTADTNTTNYSHSIICNSTNLVLYLSSTGSSWNIASGTIITSNASLLNTWAHVALVRNGTTFTVYVNGVSKTTVTSALALFSNTGNITFGHFPTGFNDYFPGYLSNVRIVKGTAVYTANFTPPTTPLTAITNTSLLTCQSNRFIDNSANALAITLSGTPKVQAFQPFSPSASYTTAAYGGSVYFNGSSDYLSLTNSTTLNPGTGNFTLEYWVYFNALNQGNIYDGSINGVSTALNASSQFSVGQSNVAYLLNDTVAAVTGQWYHIAIARSGTTLSLFKNGTRVATATNSTNFVSSTANRIGWNGVSIYLNGYVSNLRFIVGGTPVYDPTQTTITVPTSPVSASATLLVNGTNAGIYDAAVQNNVITIGDAQASTTQSKWSPTSMKFDGTGDWLTAIDGPQLQLGTGDFTIDGWVYLSATGVAYGIISKGTASTGWSVNVTSGNKLQFSYTASNLTGATSLASATWYYFAVVRSGSATENLKVYLNGTADATSGGAVTDNFNQTSILYVGADRVGGSALNGYLQDLRITKGVARTITTPTSAFPTQ